MPPAEAERIAHILEAIEKIQTRVGHLDERGLAADDVLLDSVLYQLAVIGEAANRLSAELRARNPAIPWAQIVAFRNRLVHEYHSVSARIVWQTIQRNLPELRAAMDKELARDG